MKLGLVTYNLARSWDLETLIQRCEETRFEGVELRTTHAHGVESTLSPGRRKEVRKRFADSKVTLVGLGTAFEFHSPDAKELEKNIEGTREYIRLAHDLGASGVKVRPNALVNGVKPEDTLTQIAHALRTCGEYAAGFGVKVRLEVHGRETQRFPHIRRILEQASHGSVKLCWNSNPTDLEDNGLEANFRSVADRIDLVHMRDLYLEDYPWKEFFRLLNGIGYGGYCLAEIPESTDPVRVMHYYRALFREYLA